MKKVIRIGTVLEYSRISTSRVPTDVFAKIEHDGDRLSISGVIGPMSNGDARGSSGQFIMSFKEYDSRGHMNLADITPASGWTPDLIKRFFDAWDRWHLNDMRANCEHQKGADWDASRKIELTYYTLTTDAMRVRNDARGIAAAAAVRGEVAQLTKQQHALLALTDWFKERTSPPDADSPLSGCYEAKKRETKTVGWIYPTEHPSGLLGKPCTVCGYKYGSAWKREEVPAEVIEFLQSLPDADKTPAWV